MSEEEFILNPPEFWPMVLSAVMKGLADESSALIVLSLGGAMWQLRRSLIDYEVLSLGKVFAYITPDEEVAIVNYSNNANYLDAMDVTTAAETPTNGSYLYFPPIHQHASVDSFEKSFGSKAC
jgi:hypothetical protein